MMMDSYKHFTGRPLTWIGALLVINSIGSVFGTYGDIAQGFLRKALGLPEQETSQLLSVGLLLLGIALVAVDQYGLRRDRKAPKRLLAVRHASLNPSSVPLLAEVDLPAEGGPWALERLDCDLTRHLSGGQLEPERAVSDQEHLWATLEAQLRVPNPPRFAYYGVAHIPLQILGGCQLAHVSPLLFELVRKDSTWRELRQDAAPALHLRTQKTLSKSPPSALVVRIAVSYPVDVQDVREIISEPFDDVLVTVAKTAPDIITHYAHAEAIAAAVRSAIDSGRARLAPGGKIHLFFAGPMAVGFSIGRRITRTIHPEVIAYNYSMQASPRYHWGVSVNSPPGSPKVLRPVPPTPSKLPVGDSR
jgi:hypothetical protein